MSNKEFEIKNGILQKYCGTDSEVVIPDGVTIIGAEAFYEDRDAEKVIIPEGVRVISSSAFDSSKLKEIVLPQTLERIESEAFRFTNLSSISIPDSVEEIGERCFVLCNIKELNHPLLKIENGLAIKDNCLLYCADRLVKNVVIPETVETISSFAFEMCDEMESVTIPSSVKDIQDCAFNLCSNLKSVKLSEGLKEIGEMAFNTCKRLGLVTIPKSVESVGYGAFHGTNRFGNLLKCKNDYYGYEQGVRIYNSDGSLDIYDLDEYDEKSNMYRKGEKHIVHFKNDEAMKAAGWEVLD